MCVYRCGGGEVEMGKEEGGGGGLVAVMCGKSNPGFFLAFYVKYHHVRGLYKIGCGGFFRWRKHASVERHQQHILSLSS